MGGGSPGVSLPDLGGIWFAVSASFPGRVIVYDGRVHRLGALLALWCCFFVWLVCLSSGRSPALCVALCGSWGHGGVNDGRVCCFTPLQVVNHDLPPSPWYEKVYLR